MKIVIVGPNVGMGGVERASSNVANGLAELGHDVTYLALISEQQFFELKTKYKEPIGFNQNSMDLIKTLQYIRTNIKLIQPDAILCFTKFYAALANLALVFSKFSIVVTERSSPLYQWSFKVELVAKFSFWLKKPKAVISQTSIASSYHQKYYGSIQYHIIPNPVREIEMYPEIEREKIILAVGRFHDDCKGFDLLVQAFNYVESKDWRLVFAGGSKEEGKYLLDLVHEDKKDQIDFLGIVKDMDHLYARAGIFVMPSRSEGFPNALAEALCAGCCCVSFDFTAGPRDLIKDGENGVLVPAEDVEKMALEIQALISDEGLRQKYQWEALSLREKLKQETIVKKYQEALAN